MGKLGFRGAALYISDWLAPLSMRDPRTRVPRLGLLGFPPDPIHGSPSRGSLVASSDDPTV